MILDEDLTEFEKAGTLSYTPVVQNPDDDWALCSGRISKEMVENFMPHPIPGEDDSLIMTCGPPKLKEAMSGLYEDLGWNNTY